MTADPRKAAEEYLEVNKLPQLLELMTAELLFHKPDDPRAFIVDYLTKVKTGGTRPLLDEKDLETVFGMFDVVQRGVVTVEQADAALRNVLGPSSSLGLEVGATLTKEQFVDSMSKAMQANVPYKQ